MKTLLLITLMIGSISFAQTISSGDTTVVLPKFNSLKEAMKDMSLKLRTISKQAADATKNASSETLTLEFVNSVTAAKALYPQSAQDADAKTLYVKMMDNTIALGNDLAAAFHQNNNAQAAIILNKLSQAKTDGHNEFK